MNNFDMGIFQGQFPQKQYAYINPDNPKEYKTFFLQRDQMAKKISIIRETNYVYGEVPPHIQVIHPLHYKKYWAEQHTK